MRRTVRSRRSLAAVAMVLAWSNAGWAGAEPAPEPEADAFKEQTIYIPYAKLREVFEKQGRGVFLPYEEFHKLWEAARKTIPPPTMLKPPVNFLITEAAHEAVVSSDVVTVQATLRIELLAEGWHKIPLRLGDAAITNATLDGRPARVVHDPATGYILLLQHESQDSAHSDLILEYAKAFDKAPGQNSVTFQAPQAPVSRWRIRIPEPGVKVDVRPLIAATEVPVADSEETEVLAFVGAAPAVRLGWTPRAEGAAGLDAIANVRAEQQLWIEEGVRRTRCQLSYTISRSTLDQLAVEVPGDHKVVGVYDANVRQWSVEQVDDRQRIDIQLFEPAKHTQIVIIELEQLTDASQLMVPQVKALGVGRQSGIMVTHVAEGLQVEVSQKRAVLQLDAGELPQSLSDQEWVLAHRYAALPFDLQLAVEKIQPRILADSLVAVMLEPQQLTLDMVTVYTIEKAGVFRLALDIPAGFEVRRVEGRSLADIQPAEVDAHFVDAQAGPRLVVNLSRRAKGRVALSVRLQKSLSEPHLLSPTGNSAEIPVLIPAPQLAEVARRSGRVVVYAPESLRVNPTELTELHSISLNEAFQGMESLRRQASARSRPTLAFRSAQDQAALTLQAQRRKPQLTVGQLLVARIEAGVVKYHSTLHYDIRYSGVSALRIDVPAELSSEIRIRSAGIRRAVLQSAPEDVPEGYVAWSLSGETEFLGAVTVQLAWEQNIDKIQVGKSLALAVPRLRPADVDRAWGQIVLTKAENVDVRESEGSSGLRPIDPQHDLMKGARVADATRAFEFHEDWLLPITATRYKLEEIKRTSIDRAVLRMVLTRSGETAVQALYRVRSARQRLPLQLPKNVSFDREPLRINGRAVPLERGDQDQFFVPLVGLNADTPFHLELRYTVRQRGARLESPIFPSEPAVQKVYLCAYLPAEQEYIGSGGPWTEEMRWRFFSPLDRRPVPVRKDKDLVNWVQQGLNVAGNPAESFPTDGRLYLFSTLRPAQALSGYMRLRTIHQNWLSALIFLVLVPGGLLLLRKTESLRVLAVGAVVVAVLLLGVFFPTFSLQVMDGKLLAALIIVVLAWCLHYLVWVRPHDPVVAALRQTRQQSRVARIWARAGRTRDAAAPAEPAQPEPTPSPEASPGADPDSAQEGGGGRG